MLSASLNKTFPSFLPKLVISDYINHILCFDIDVFFLKSSTHRSDFVSFLVECNHLAQTRNDIFGRCGVVESFQFHPDLLLIFFKFY